MERQHVLEKVLPKVVPRATYFRNTLLRPINEGNAPTEYIQNILLDGYLLGTQWVSQECMCV